MSNINEDATYGLPSSQPQPEPERTPLAKPPKKEPQRSINWTRPMLDRFRRAYLKATAGRVKQSTQHKGEFLQRGDDDLGAVNQRRRQLLGILINRLDHALCVFNLVDGILQLLVQHAPVGDNDDTIKNFLVGVVVQAGEPVGQP